MKMKYRKESTILKQPSHRESNQTILLRPHEPVMLYKALLNSSPYNPRLIKTQFLENSFQSPRQEIYFL